ncbi:hypothetical protein HMPREF9539_05513, partial [Escherichia coli MS 110-3]
PQVVFSFSRVEDYGCKGMISRRSFELFIKVAYKMMHQHNFYSITLIFLASMA